LIRVETEAYVMGRAEVIGLGEMGGDREPVWQVRKGVGVGSK